MPFSPSIESSTTNTVQEAGRRPLGSSSQSCTLPVRAILLAEALSFNFCMRRKSPAWRGEINRGRLAPTGLVKGLITQAFRIVHALPVAGKQRGLRLPSEVIGLAFKSYEPLEARPTCAGPHLDRTHHKRFCKAIKNAHEKAPAFDRLGQRTMEGE